MLPYYNQKQLIARVDKNGNVLGEIEKWEAHKKGILHKALTVTIIFKGNFVVQERKHPAFDKVFDLSSSSHPLFVNNNLQTVEEATYFCLKREWNLEKKDISNLKNHGSIFYEAKDPNSEFVENEMCEVITVTTKREPEPNLDFAYGSFIATKEEVLDKNSETYQRLAPWVKVMIEDNKL